LENIKEKRYILVGLYDNKERKLHLERGSNVLYKAKKEGEPSFIKRVLYLNI
jgi:hypothetical protein